MYTYTHLFTCWFRYLDIMYFQNLRSTRSSDDGRSHLFSLLSITMSFFITLYSLHAHIIRYRDVMLSPAKHLFRCMAFGELESTYKFSYLHYIFYTSGNNNDISYCYYTQITIYRYKYITD